MSCWSLCQLRVTIWPVHRWEMSILWAIEVQAKPSMPVKLELTPDSIVYRKCHRTLWIALALNSIQTHRDTFNSVQTHRLKWKREMGNNSFSWNFIKIWNEITANMNWGQTVPVIIIFIILPFTFVPGGNDFLGSQDHFGLCEYHFFSPLFFLWWGLVIQTRHYLNWHPFCYDEVFIFQINCRIKEQRAHWNTQPVSFEELCTNNLKQGHFFSLWNLSRWPLTHPLYYFRSAFFLQPSTCMLNLKSSCATSPQSPVLPLTDIAHLFKVGNSVFLILAAASALDRHFYSLMGVVVP